jgi:hypothetical protein
MFNQCVSVRLRTTGTLMPSTPGQTSLLGGWLGHQKTPYDNNFPMIKTSVLPPVH